MEEMNKYEINMAEEKDNLFERYKMVVAARNFHYENFNKWLTYFYVANAAILVGYMQVVSSTKTGLQGSEIPILLLGHVAGLLLYFSSKGYYYWNIHWISLINHYEDKIFQWKDEERIYTVFANKHVQNNYFRPTMGANFSTSKIAILFSFIIASSWGALLTSNLNYSFFKIWSEVAMIYQGIIYMLISMAFILLLSLFIYVANPKVSKEVKDQMKKEKQIKKNKGLKEKKYLLLASNLNPLLDLKYHKIEETG